ncbi:putative PurR-regulated permease PerM [Natranaerovirga hydrolytica]|uniref:Putative PurR-regulated permease PerM n=1 Tax=Natranaerovirga hydrolytica TaxID=680378 RepID=A0A4V2Q090_9FIRM|nr:AI-2E family transporter [Natranaerovirga hydrolytica]TCK92781.1 putative PurR-regulated permease PerM [Natranaerovirga hydrolytica]
MKFNFFDKKYTNIIKHIILTAVLLYVCFFAITNISKIYSFIISVLSRTISLFSPLLIGIILAYLLNPFVTFYHHKVVLKLRKNKKPKNRLGATALAFISVITLFFIAGYAISWNVRTTNSFTNINDAILILDEFLKGFNNIAGQVQDVLSEYGILEQGEEVAGIVINTVSSVVQIIGNEIIAFMSKLGGYVVNIAISLVITFYLLMDKDKLLKEWNRFLKAVLSSSVINKIKGFWNEADKVFSGYIRGQLIDVMIMSVLISITLLIIGVDFAIIIGVISGFANLIPMVGSIVATIMAVFVALVGDNPMKAVYALICLIILQQIDGNIIVPKVVGTNVNLNPLMVLLAIFIGGSLFGILGMIVAVPITALGKHFYNQFIDSRIKKIEQTERQLKKEKQNSTKEKKPVNTAE